MIEVAGPMAFKKEFKNGAARGDVQVERAVHELELPHTAIEQALQVFEESGQGSLAHGNIKR